MGNGADTRSQSRKTDTIGHLREIKMPAIRSRLGFSAALAIFAASAVLAAEPNKYDTGATDTEIKVGNIMPYSGPASAYGVIGKTEQAYFNKINAEGGINGRKINFIPYETAIARPRPWNRRASSSRATKCC